MIIIRSGEDENDTVYIWRLQENKKKDSSEEENVIVYIWTPETPRE